jgi:hypothetical protein
MQPRNLPRNLQPANSVTRAYEESRRVKSARPDRRLVVGVRPAARPDHIRIPTH